MARLFQRRQIGRLGLEGVIAGFAMLAAAPHEEGLQASHPTTAVRRDRSSQSGYRRRLRGIAGRPPSAPVASPRFSGRRLRRAWRSPRPGPGWPGQARRIAGGSGFEHGSIPHGCSPQFRWMRCGCARSARPAVRNGPDAPPLRRRRRHRRSSGNCGHASLSFRLVSAIRAPKPLAATLPATLVVTASLLPQAVRLSLPPAMQ